MQRWIWVIIAVCVSTAVYFTIRYGLRPKPIPVMNPTSFEHAEQIGIVVYKRLRQNLRAERVVILGSSGSEEDARIWEGLLKAAYADGERPIAFAGADTQDSDFLKNVAASLKAGQLVVVKGRTEEVSHLVAGSLSKGLERLVGHPVLSISTLRLVVQPEEYDSLQTQCLDARAQASNGQRLDCAAQKVARKFLKKRLAPEKLWAVMERHGLKEYLLFIHRP